MATAVYGVFTHDRDEVYVISATKEAIKTPRGVVRSLKSMIVIGGTLIPPDGSVTPAFISAMLGARQAAYQSNNYDFAIYDNNNNLIFNLPSAGSYGGVCCTQPPSLSNVDGAQFATALNWQATLEAEYPYYPDQHISNWAIAQYQESLTFSGGFPILVVRPCVNQGPVEQVTSPRSPYFATQSGVLVTIGGPPIANPPQWPNYLLNSSSVSYISPDVFRGNAIQQGVQWNYQFASATPLLGLPSGL